jgi:glucose/arabinose dehydrogenase
MAGRTAITASISLVAYVAFQNGKPVGAPKAVVTGFASDDEKRLYGAPVGLARDGDGDS